MVECEMCRDREENQQRKHFVELRHWEEESHGCEWDKISGLRHR